MLYSQGIQLKDLGIPRSNGALVEQDNRKIWHLFAKHYHLFLGTPSRMWLDTVFQNIFHMEEPLSSNNADLYYDTIDTALKTPEFLPHALLKRFNIEFLATTEDALNPLEAHQ